MLGGGGKGDKEGGEDEKSMHNNATHHLSISSNQKIMKPELLDRQSPWGQQRSRCISVEKAIGMVGWLKTFKLASDPIYYCTASKLDFVT